METNRISANRTARKKNKVGGSPTTDLAKSCFPTKSDKRPDPTVLTSEERLTEFGKLILRAIERKAAKT